MEPRLNSLIILPIWRIKLYIQRRYNTSLPPIEVGEGNVLTLVCLNNSKNCVNLHEIQKIGKTIDQRISG